MTIRNSFSNAWEVVPVTLPSGASQTDIIDLGGLRLFAIGVPSSWTTANLTFQMSPDGGTTWNNLYDQNGNEITAVADVSSCLTLNPSQFAFIQYLRIRSGTKTTPVAQTADRTLQLMLRTV